MNKTKDGMGPGRVVWSECPGLWRDPGRMSGAWCFKDSRVPLDALFTNLEDTGTLGEFLMDFEIREGRAKAHAALLHVAGRLGGADPTPTNEYRRDRGEDPTGAVDWRKCQWLRRRAETAGGGTWAFEESPEDEASELFKHIAAGGTTAGYCSRSYGTSEEAANGVMRFVARTLETA